MWGDFFAQLFYVVGNQDGPEMCFHIKYLVLKLGKNSEITVVQIT